MNIEVEIIEFYPIEKDDERETLSGTMRIRLVDFEIEILGIHINKCQDRWYFNLPSRKGTHHETGAPVRYPNVVFTDREKHRQFIDAIRKKGRAFVECRLFDTGKPLIFPKKAQQASGGVRVSKAQDRPVAQKETASIAKPKPSPTIASKEWRDPPKRTKPHQARRK